ncbi:hypothetical protein, partial [Klebsiella pneumoniae]|uniref:hypothetical protein n=1 Tax=Klebsiella pneumoniae TaxID=573 RepID=UPI003EC0FE13
PNPGRICDDFVLIIFPIAYIGQIPVSLCYQILGIRKKFHKFQLFVKQAGQMKFLNSNKMLEKRFY